MSSYSTRRTSMSTANEPLTSSSASQPLSSPTYMQQLPKAPRTTCCSFLLVFTAISVCQIIIACVVIWYLGFSTAESSVQLLSQRFRQEIIQRIVDQLSLQLISPVRVAENLEYDTRRRLPNISIADPPPLTNITGSMADLSFQITLHPSINSVGLIFANNFLYSARWNVLPNNHTGTNTNLITYSIAETNEVIKQQIISYTPQNISNFTQWNQVIPDLNENTTPTQLWNFLLYSNKNINNTNINNNNNNNNNYYNTTSSVYTINNYLATTKPYWLVASPQGLTSWTDTFIISNSFIPLVGIYAVKAYIRPQVTTLGNSTILNPIGFVAYSGIYLNTVDTFLSSIPVGNNGEIFIFKITGELVSTSYTPLSIINRGGNSIWINNSTDPYLIACKPALITAGFINMNSISTQSGNNIFNNIILDIPLNIYNQPYHLAARALKLNGLSWFVVVITSDRAYDGNLYENIIISSLWSLLVLGVSIISTTLVVFSVSRPINITVKRMQQIQAIQTFDSARQRIELTKLVNEWNDHYNNKNNKNNNNNNSIIDTKQPLLFNSLPHSKSSLSSSTSSSDILASNQSTPRTSKTIFTYITLCYNISKFYINWLIEKLAQIPIKEVQAMKQAFSCMLDGMKVSYDQIELERERKRFFIRFLFHEIRVPFNCIALGIEHLAEETDQRSESNTSSKASSPRNGVPRLPTQASHQLPLLPAAPPLIKAASLPASASLVSTSKTALQLELNDIIPMLHDQCKTVAHILNDTLSLQKIEDGALQLECVPFDLEHMIQMTIRSFRTTAKEKYIDLQYDLQQFDENKLWKNIKNEQIQKSVDQLYDTSIQINSIPSPVAAENVSFSSSSPAISTSSSTTPLQDHLTRSSSQDSDPNQSPISNSSSSSYYVVGDEFRLRQVLSNFISNALKFTPKNGRITVSLTISPIINDNRNNNNNIRRPTDTYLSEQDLLTRGYTIRLPPADHASFTISVTDTGVGLCEADQNKLFTPYVQINAGVLQKGLGTGLGLSICKSLIKLHHGTIGSKSTLNIGSTFFITVPLQIVQKQTIQQQPQITNNSHQGSMISPISSTRLLHRTSSVTSSIIDVKIPTKDKEPLLKERTNISDGNAIMTNKVKRTHSNSDKRQSTLLSNIDNTNNNDNNNNNKEEVELSKSVSLLDDVHSASIYNRAISVPPRQNRRNSSVNDQIINTMQPSEDLPVSMSFSGARTRSSSSSVSTANHSNTNKMPPLHTKTPQLALSSLPEPSPLRVLVVEDSAPNRKLLMMILQRLNCIVSGAENGLIAVQLFEQYYEEKRQQQQQSAVTVGSSTALLASTDNTNNNIIYSNHDYPFDLCLIDGNMPVMDGPECTRRLREMNITIPIIAVTGNAMAEDQKAFLTSGANFILVKPVQKKSLENVLKQYGHKN